MFENNFTVLLIAILIILFFGRLLGEMAKKIGFPEITGELLAGILLGPTFLGKINLNLYETLFCKSQDVPYVLDYFFQLSLIFIMFTSGLKIDFLSVMRQKKTVFLITIFGTFIPFCVGILIAHFIPDFFLVAKTHYSDFTFPLFLGISFAIGAVPVIAKILIDAQIIHTSIGTIIISSAVLTDVIGWGAFAFILNSKESPTIYSIIFMAGSFILMLKLGKKLMHFLKK